MNKKEFIEAYAERMELTKVDAKEMVGGFLDLVKETLTEGDEIVFPGFGKFEVKTRSERTARNPQTGETVTVPASNAVHFKAGKLLKDAVNQK